jgi:hypothetical protein
MPDQAPETVRQLLAKIALPFAQTIQAHVTVNCNKAKGMPPPSSPSPMLRQGRAPLTPFFFPCAQYHREAKALGAPLADAFAQSSDPRITDTQTKSLLPSVYIPRVAEVRILLFQRLYSAFFSGQFGVRAMCCTLQPGMRGVRTVAATLQVFLHVGVHLPW